MDEVGLHKVDAIKNALNLTMPNLEIEALNHRIAGQEPPITQREHFKAFRSATSC